MIEAHRQEAWQHTAWIACVIAEVNRDRKKRPTPFTPDDFNPMVPKRAKSGNILVTRENIGDLKAAFDSLQKGK